MDGMRNLEPTTGSSISNRVLYHLGYMCAPCRKESPYLYAVYHGPIERSSGQSIDSDRRLVYTRYVLLHGVRERYSTWPRALSLHSVYSVGELLYVGTNFAETSLAYCRPGVEHDGRGLGTNWRR